MISVDKHVTVNQRILNTEKLNRICARVAMRLPKKKKKMVKLGQDVIQLVASMKRVRVQGLDSQTFTMLEITILF